MHKLNEVGLTHSSLKSPDKGNKKFIVDPENKFTFSDIYVIVYDYGIFNRFTQTRP